MKLGHLAPELELLTPTLNCTACLLGTQEPRRQGRRNVPKEKKKLSTHPTYFHKAIFLKKNFFFLVHWQSPTY